MTYKSDASMQQDRWVVEEVFRGRTTPGFFLEAGASDGVGASNTYALEMGLGWTGILCEPNSRFFENLERNRPGSTRVKACLSDHDGEIEFIEAGYLGTAPKHVAATFANRGLDLDQHENYQHDADGAPAARVRVPAFRLDTLLARCGAPETIDYMSLDLEGGEYAALSSFPFDTHRVLAMTIENHFESGGMIHDSDHCGPVRNLLASHGYELVKTVFADDFFLHPSMCSQ